MNIKNLVAIFFVLLLSFITGCEVSETEPSTDEIITVDGLNEVHIYIGESFDFMEGVTFTSNTRGDITSSVEMLQTIDTNAIGVSILTYRTYYENNTIFEAERRIIVLYPPFSTENDGSLITNGDFIDTINYWSIHNHNDHQADIFYNVDPDLLRLQVVIEYTSDMISWPSFAHAPISIDVNNTYRFSILVSGTESTFFTFDVVELNQTIEVVNVIAEPVTIDVGLDSEGMTIVTFDFVPLMSSEDAIIRLMFGGNGMSAPSGHIFIDNVSLKVVE